MTNKTTSNKKFSNYGTHNGFGSIELYYSEYYEKMMGQYSTGLMSFLWKYPHKLIEKPFRRRNYDSILELGAGSGEHISFVKSKFNEYLALDTDKNLISKIKKDFKIKGVVGDAERLIFVDDYFDRVIATCLLAHLSHPEQALSEWRRVAKSGSTISIYMPCEPGLALRIFRKLISAPKARRLGFKGFELYIARDHKNDFNRMKELILFVFRHDKIRFKYRPLVLSSWYLNLFSIVEIEVRK